MKLISKTVLLIAIIILWPVTYEGPQRVSAQFGGGGGIDTLIDTGVKTGIDAGTNIVKSFLGGDSGGSGEVVTIVSDLSETAVTSALQNTLTRLLGDVSAGQLQSINLKETVLDPIAWNMSKQLQQQLTGNLLKWIGGELPGQNGEVPFVQDFEEHYGKIVDEIAGEFLFGPELTGSCSPEQDFKARKLVYEYVVAQNSDQLFQCPNVEADSADDDNLLKRIFTGTVNCTGNSLCAGYKGQNALARKQAEAVAVERQKLNISGGMKSQEVCKTINDPDGYPRRKCEIVNPLYLAKDSTSFQLTQVPSLQLLQMDEFNEIVSDLMSNLTNQALTGLNGILGLTSNPNYSSSVFGPNGNLSYLDALAQDDITKYQAVGVSPIKEALTAEQRYFTLQQQILSEIAGLEAKLAAIQNCSNLTLTDELQTAKTDATVNLNVSSTTLALLVVLDQQYDNAKDANTRSAVTGTFLDYKSQNFFRTEYQNQQLELTYINLTFAQMVDQFEYDIAATSESCGGPFDYDGPLTS